MANQSAGFFLEVTLVDSSNTKTNMEFELVATVYADVLTDVVIILNALVAVTRSVIAVYRIVQKWYDDAFVVPTVGRTNKEKAVISGIVEGNPTKSVVFSIPNPQDTLFAGAIGTRNFNVVDTGDAALITYKGLFGAGGQCLLSDGEELDAVLTGGVRVTRSSRNP